MAALSPRNIYSLVNGYGFADPVTATAVVLGESGGDPRAVNRNSDGSLDRGLWQINSRWHPNVTEAQAFSLDYSTRYALTLSKGGTDFGPWNATKSPNFPTHLRTARAAVNDDVLAVRDREDDAMIGSPAEQVTDAAGRVYDAAISPIIDPIKGVASLAAKALGVLTSADFWKRAGLVVLGVAVLILGAVVLFGRDALKLTPAGAAAGAASAAATEVV